MAWACILTTGLEMVSDNIFLFSAETQIAVGIHGSLALYFGLMGHYFLFGHQWFVCFWDFSCVPFFTRATYFSSVKHGTRAILVWQKRVVWADSCSLESTCSCLLFAILKTPPLQEWKITQLNSWSSSGIATTFSMAFWWLTSSCHLWHLWWQSDGQ